MSHSPLYVELMFDYAMSEQPRKIEILHELLRFGDRSSDRTDKSELQRRYRYLKADDFLIIFQHLLSAYLHNLHKGTRFRGTGVPYSPYAPYAPYLPDTPYPPYPYSVLRRRMDQWRSELIAESMRPERIIRYRIDSGLCDLGNCFDPE